MTLLTSIGGTGFDKQYEFVAAKPDNCIVGSNHAQQTSGGSAEDKIPGGMSERIVNGLEVIRSMRTIYPCPP